MSTTIERITEVAGKSAARKLSSYLSEGLLEQSLLKAQSHAALSDEDLKAQLRQAVIGYERDQTSRFADFLLEALIFEADRRDEIAHEQDCPAIGSTWSNVLVAYRSERGMHALAEDRLDLACTCVSKVIRVRSKSGDHLVGPFTDDETVTEVMSTLSEWAANEHPDEIITFSVQTVRKPKALADLLG